MSARKNERVIGNTTCKIPSRKLANRAYVRRPYSCTSTLFTPVESDAARERAAKEAAEKKCKDLQVNEIDRNDAMFLLI